MLFMVNNNWKQLKHPKIGEWYLTVLSYSAVFYKILFTKILLSSQPPPDPAGEQTSLSG